MKEVNGYTLPFDFTPLRKKADLIEMDGPLLSLYQNDQGDNYLFYWVDADDTRNRWMFLRVQFGTLIQYLHHKFSLRDVLLHPSDSIIWITDCDNTGEWKDTQCLSPANLPEEYLPEENSYFEFGHEESLEKNLAVDKYELTVPVNDRSFFEELVRKMGWKTTSEELLQNT